MAKALSRQELKCTFQFSEPKYFTPGFLNKEQGRGNKSSSRSWWQTHTPTINEEWQVFWQTRHPHTSLITQALLVRSVDVCVWPWNSQLRLELEPTEHPKGSSHLFHKCLVMLTQWGQPPAVTYHSWSEPQNCLGTGNPQEINAPREGKVSQPISDNFKGFFFPSN